MKASPALKTKNAAWASNDSLFLESPETPDGPQDLLAVEANLDSQINLEILLSQGQQEDAIHRTRQECFLVLHELQLAADPIVDMVDLPLWVVDRT